ncbi:hypothetical protein L9W92_13225 [Pelotomaculum terephthalicicum JT]|uniref:hypothetical protein n=1 Tax=Pelotomaculum TaxID=191373 RepID=UPI0009CAE457|nr:MULTISPECIES: hypothetical protein [Pelotomaculum]MCG9968996.1 hypothetical protein [Pelotomaculum terephthalicicum JT]OPX87668.1 MAG: TM2 domain protein [Pelotomaculum sp. PtaB.Bin117]
MNQDSQGKKPWVAALWSFIFPGFGQFYNGDYLVGIVLIILEIIVNINSNLNLSIYYTFNGDFAESFKVVDWKWILFYPSILNLGMWQAYYRAGGKGNGFFIGFQFGGSFGLYWSLLGSPMFGGMLGGFIGALMGRIIEKRFKE